MNPVKFIMLIIFVPFGLLVLGFILLILKLVSKTRQSAWKGEVVDKLYNERREDDKTVGYCTLVVKTDEGLTRKIAVTGKMYNECKVGDKLEKPKGALNPVKV
jgi:hypothetical protein